MLNKVVIFYLYIFCFVFSREENTYSRPYVEFAGARFRFYQNGDSPNKYIWIHGDEQTAKLALTHHIEKYGGIAFLFRAKLEKYLLSLLL